MKRSLTERYKRERLNRLIVERTFSRGTAPSKVFQTWAYLTLNGPKTVSELQAELPKTLSSNTAINFCVSNNVLLRNGDVISANPTYDWDDEGVVSPKFQRDKLAIASREATKGMPTRDAEIDNLRDVYKELESNYSSDIERAIKEFAKDVTSKQKIQNVLLAHAANANIGALKLLFGDSNIKLTPDESHTYGVSGRDISAMCDRFKNVARRLDGENGLIAQVVDNCRPEAQMAYMYIIRYLMKKFNMPVETYHFINAVKNKCYNLAAYLYGKLSLADVFALDEVLPYIDELPSELLNIIIDDLNNKESIDELGQLFIYALKNDDRLFNIIKTKVGIRTPFGKRLTQYVKDNDKEADEILSDKLLNNLLAKLNL